LLYEGHIKIVGNIFRVGDKKPFITLQGEWNHLIYIKRCGGGDSKEMLFTDVRQKPDVEKECITVAQQEDRESRRLWRHVTAALFQNRIDVASRSKRWIEQRQRSEAKERAEKGQTWMPKYFRKVDGRWIYTQRFEDRINSSSV